MEEVGNDLSVGAHELVLESSPQMADEVAKELSAGSAVAVAAEDSVMDSGNASVAADGVGSVPITNGEKYPSVEDLIAKARAPVKREYVILNTGPRVMAKSIVMAERVKTNSPQEGIVNAPETSNTVTAKASVDRKSKRQLRRERKEARSNKSAENICGAVAKSGDMKACKYGASCRFNHDLIAFLAQKPADLKGTCPFSGVTATCPYGCACRYSGSHPEMKGVDGTEVLKDGNLDSKTPMSSIRELNNLNKSFQKLLWKNAVSFPKADCQLQVLGLLGRARKMIMKQSTEEKGEIKALPSSDVTSAEMEPASIKGEGVEAEVFPVSVAVATEVERANTDEVETPMKEAARIISSHMKNEAAELSENGSKKFKGSSTSSSNGADEYLPPHKKVRITVDELAGDSGLQIEDEGMKPTEERDTVMHEADSDDFKYTSDKGRIPLREKKLIDFRGKLYLAPLTTVGNLPFRRICKRLGADITCGEMAMCTNLLQGQASEWALLRRHEEEDIFGVQICGSYADTVSRAAELIERECTVDFIDLNLGCPIDVVVNKGGGSSLLCKPQRLQEIVKATSATIDSPLTLKLRMGFFEGRNCAHTLIPDLGSWGASAVTIHGRTRQQRYSKLADWDYINECASKGPGDIQMIGNGDVFSFTEYNEHLQSAGSKLATCMIARGALIKPWLFTEIKEQRHWDITAEERLNIMRDFVRFGLIHWGSDSKGVETTRHFLLEWLSYAHRYIPVGLLEVIPQKLNWRPPNYFGRNDLETLMSSDSAADWVRLTEMMLGPPPAGFVFSPKHKSNAYDKAENG